MIYWLTPYQFSWLAVIVYPGAALAYYLGMRSVRAGGGRTGFWRPFMFFTGVALCFIWMQTRLDYYSQFLFFMHRIQHLVLHHTGAMLIALGLPMKYWRAAVPRSASTRVYSFLNNYFSNETLAALGRILTSPVRMLQHPLIGSFMFVGLIYFWLTPAIHFNAMLSYDRYLVMNWSMVIDGVLFWMVVIDPEPPEKSRMPNYGTRFMMIIGTTFPQILLGAFITLSTENLYKVYAVCGRAWPISPKTDQLYGGLMTWIPPAMMEGAALLIVLSLLMARDRETMQASYSTQSRVTEEGT